MAEGNRWSLETAGFVQQHKPIVGSSWAGFNIPVQHKGWWRGNWKCKPKFLGITCWTECKEGFHNLILTNKAREWKVWFVQKGTAALKKLTLKVAAKQQLEWITIIVNNIHYCRKAVSQSIQIPNISMMHELTLWLLGHDWNNGLNTSSHHTPSISHSVSKKWKAQLSCTACKYLPELSMYLRFSIS